MRMISSSWKRNSVKCGNYSSSRNGLNYDHNGIIRVWISRQRFFRLWIAWRSIPYRNRISGQWISERLCLCTIHHSENPPFPRKWGGTGVLQRMAWETSWIRRKVKKSAGVVVTSADFFCCRHYPSHTFTAKPPLKKYVFVQCPFVEWLKN